jgi:methyl-accepting chemotaxis protein
MEKSEKVRKKPAPSVSQKSQNRYVLAGGSILFLYSLVLVFLGYLFHSPSSLLLTDSVNNPIRNPIFALLFLVLFSCISSFLIVLIFVHRFFEPFYRLKEKVFRLAEKNLTTRMDMNDAPDFVDIAEDFNLFLDDFERTVLVLRLEQEEVSMILLKAKKEAHLQSTKDILDKISRHNERIIEHLLAYRVIGDR